MKHFSYALAVLGVSGGLLLISYFGIGHVASALGRVGWPRFGAIVGWQFALFAYGLPTLYLIFALFVLRGAWMQAHECPWCGMSRASHSRAQWAACKERGKA